MYYLFKNLLFFIIEGLVFRPSMLKSLPTPGWIRFRRAEFRAREVGKELMLRPK